MFSFYWFCWNFSLPAIGDTRFQHILSQKNSNSFPDVFSYSNVRGCNFYANLWSWTFDFAAARHQIPSSCGSRIFWSAIIGVIFEKRIGLISWGQTEAVRMRKWKIMISPRFFQIERARSPHSGRVRRCSWVFLKGLSMGVWDFAKKKPGF